MLSYIRTHIPLDVYYLDTDILSDIRTVVHCNTLDNCCYLDLSNETYKFLLNHSCTIITNNIRLYAYTDWYRYNITPNTKYVFAQYISACVMGNLPVCIPVIIDYVSKNHILTEDILKLHNPDILNHCILQFGYNDVCHTIISSDDIDSYTMITHHISNIQTCIKHNALNIFKYILEHHPYQLNDLLKLILIYQPITDIVECLLVRTKRINKLKLAANLLTMYPKLHHLIPVKWHARNNYILRYLLLIADINVVKLVLHHESVIDNLSLMMRTYIEYQSIIQCNAECLSLIGVDKISLCWSSVYCYSCIALNDAIDFYPYLHHGRTLITVCIHYRSYKLLSSLAQDGLFTSSDINNILGGNHSRSMLLDNLLVNIITYCDCESYIAELARLCTVLGLSKLPLRIPNNIWNNTHLRLCISHNNIPQLEYIANICRPDNQTLDLAQLLSNKSAQRILHDIQNASLHS